jgi:spore germination protein YaaH
MKDDIGYETFVSKEATQLFKKAHDHGTRVVLTLTLFDNDSIEEFLDDPRAQQRLITESVSLVEKRGIDGINLDFEYDGDAGDGYRRKFTTFSKKITEKMHTEVPTSKVTVSVYASGAKYPKVQDIGEVAKVTDGLFMMGYDFAIASSDVAMPTAPLTGFKEGKYWYDISTAVDDFLAVMPANKLILGTPWYGLNFEVYEPGFKAATVSSYYWGRQGKIQTYDVIKDNMTLASGNKVVNGWDEIGQVGWKAYYDDNAGTWRQVYMDDIRSMGAKYDLAKDKNLLGVGIWALGYEGDTNEMWDLIERKFGNKIADIRISQKPIYELL